MARSVLLVAAVLALLPSAVDAQPNANTDDFQNRLIVQRAMAQAGSFLFERQANKAVDLLETHLPRINGNAAYLRLLRDAYRQYIKDLAIAQQDELANKYLARLSILDKDAATEVAQKSKDAPAAPAQVAVDGNAAKGGDKYYQRVVPDEIKVGTPLARLTQESVDPANVRGKEATDPFDLANQRVPAAALSQERKQQALALITQADAEFNQRHFEQARILYGRAFEAERNLTSESRDRWAYCMLNHVVEQVNGAKLDGEALKKLTDDVRCAVAMSPGLANTGRWLLEEIENRKGSPAAASTPPTPVQHSQRNGWQVAETVNFRIFHKQNREFSEKVAGVAERTRVEVLRKWFGGNGVPWRGKCDVYLHATAQAYGSATGVSATSPGHSRIETDSGNVVSRRMDLRCDIANLLNGVLPHETTHVVLAGQFGKHDVPRWADEGMAVLSEPADAIAQHRRNLAQSLTAKQTFTIRELMHLHDYPQANRVSVFYAQSVDVVAYLTELRGPLAFAEFLREGMQSGYEQSLRRHYGLASLDDLQTRWQQRALAGLQPSDGSLASGR